VDRFGFDGDFRMGVFGVLARGLAAAGGSLAGGSSLGHDPAHSRRKSLSLPMIFPRPLGTLHNKPRLENVHEYGAEMAAESEGVFLVL
jgi:hypothetical protein